MELTKKQVIDAGITQEQLAKAIGVTQGRVSQLPDNEPLEDHFQHRLKKEGKTRRKVLRHLRKNHE